jgi:hypothetical protein
MALVRRFRFNSETAPPATKASGVIVDPAI